MLEGRAFHNLGSEEDGPKVFKTILKYFGNDYLSFNHGNRPLAALWCRPDRLATVELYIFGKCLERISYLNEKWLKATIREIKKCNHDKNKARGLCTEILYLGIFKYKNVEIIPAIKNNPGYDFSLIGQNGSTQYISVKNIDVSDNLKDFNSGCRKLRAKWIEKLRLTRSNFGLLVESESYLTEDDFELIIRTIQNQPHLYDKQKISPKRGIEVSLAKVSSELPLSKIKPSEWVTVHCPPHPSEATRYALQVKKKVSNLLKHTSQNKAATRVLFMRIHVNANYSAIREAAKTLIDYEFEHSPQSASNKIDCIICFQPSYVRDSNNGSYINHCFVIESNARFAKSFQEFGSLKGDLPLGTVSSTPHSIHYNHLQGPQASIETTDYIFQQGDIYRVGDLISNSRLSLGSPVMGIREHLELHHSNGFIDLRPKIIPELEDLVLI